MTTLRLHLTTSGPVNPPTTTSTCQNFNNTLSLQVTTNHTQFLHFISLQKHTMKNMSDCLYNQQTPKANSQIFVYKCLKVTKKQNR